MTVTIVYWYGFFLNQLVIKNGDQIIHKKTSNQNPPTNT